MQNNSSKTITLGPNLHVGGNNPLLLIAGPCQIESLEHCLKIASFLKKLTNSLGLGFVFKSSFDKANRTSLKGKRGVGMQEGLKILEKVRHDLEVSVLTDIHLPEQALSVAQVVDVLQIPAFLCRQTDLLLAAGATKKAIQIKKGQFLHPEDMRYVVEKITSTGNENIILCERGTSFGYRDLVVDMRSLCMLRKIGYPVVFDATHSVQQPGGGGGFSSGERQYVAPLSRAASAVGVDGLFLECHDNPDEAPSDAGSMLPLDELEPLLKSVIKTRKAIQE